MSATMPVTASHLPYSGPDVQILTSVPRAARRAQNRLLALRGELGSWAAVGRAVGLDKGLVRRVALGQQVAPAAVVKALSRETPRSRQRPTWADVRAAFVAGALAAVTVDFGNPKPYTVATDKKAKAASPCETNRLLGNSTAVTGLRLSESYHDSLDGAQPVYGCLRRFRF